MSSPMDPAEVAEKWAECADTYLHSHDGSEASAIIEGLSEGMHHHAERAEHAISEAAGRLLDEGEPVGLRAELLDLAAKWDALAGGGRDKRSTTYSGCARSLRSRVAYDFPEWGDSVVSEVADMLSELLTRATKRADDAEDTREKLGEALHVETKRADAAEAEASQTLADLAEVTTERNRAEAASDAAGHEVTSLRQQLATLRGDLIR